MTPGVKGRTSAGLARPHWGGLSGWTPYALGAVAIWLGAQVFLSLVAERAPPSLALRLKPDSPLVLRRAADSEFQAGRFENADELAKAALVRSPFDVRALRVRGLVEARRNPDRADQIITLAGNWSLRDDPSHAWLIERRVRQGNLASALAHADTLARRRADLHPHLFNFFTTAAASDPRAVVPLARLMQSNPPWRANYLDYLYTSKNGTLILANLAAALDKTDGRFSDAELTRLYDVWLNERRFSAIHALRTHTGRPALEPLVQNGEFSNAENLKPFAWEFPPTSGAFAEQIAEGASGNIALQVQTDNFASSDVAVQTTLLLPGRYRLSGRARVERQPVQRLTWNIRCLGSNIPIVTVGFGSIKDEWAAFSEDFLVPAGCLAQTLALSTGMGDSRQTGMAWFDDLSIQPAEARSTTTPVN